MGGGNSLFPDPGWLHVNSVCFSVGILYFKIKGPNNAKKKKKKKKCIPRHTIRLHKTKDKETFLKAERKTIPCLYKKTIQMKAELSSETLEA